MAPIPFAFILTITFSSLSSATTYLEASAISGKSTFYGGNANGNACGYATVATSSFPFGYYAACGSSVFANGYGCGKCYEITCVGPYAPNPSCHCSTTTPSVVISCMDQCSECSATHFDLDPTAMARIVGPGLSGTCGVIATTVRRVSCEYTTSIKIRAKSGTSAHWYGLHIDDIAGYGSVQSVQLKSAGTSSYATTCAKSEGPSFWKCDGGFPLVVPMTVQLTNDNGDVVVFHNCITNFNGGATFDCGGNFAAHGTPTPTTITVSPTTKAPTTSACGVRNIRFVTVTQSEMYWLAFYVEDVCTSCGTITQVEVLDSSSDQNYVVGDNSDARGFWAYDDVATNHNGQPWTAPITVKITNSDNQVLTFTNILQSVDGDVQYNTNTNFCLTGVTPTPTMTTSSPVTAPPVTTPSCGKNVKFTTQTGSQMWWLAFYVDDLCCGTVTQVEAKDVDRYPTFVTGNTQYQYWYFDNADYGSRKFTAPITVRVTNSDNEVLIFTDVIQSVDPDNIYYANTNFCEQSNTNLPTRNPVKSPTASPTTKPSTSPTNNPTFKPTKYPTEIPTLKPSQAPIEPGSPTAPPTTKPSLSPTNNPTLKPSYSPVQPGSPTKAPNDPTQTPTGQTTTPTDMQCDDTCSNDDNQGDDNEQGDELQITIIFNFPKWILYDFTNIECWFYNIFIKWFSVFDFAQNFDQCDINVIVYGGHQHLGDGLCTPEPCLRNRHQVRRMLLQNGNDGNISIRMISNDDRTFNIMNTFSLDTMSNDIENKFIQEFGLDLAVEMESVEGQDNMQDQNDLNAKDSNNGTTIGVIVAVVVLAVILLIGFAVFFYLRRKKKMAKTKGTAGTEMIGGEIGQVGASNVVAYADDDDEDDEYGGTTNYNKGLVR